MPSKEGTQETLTSVVVAVPPASRHPEALGKRQNFKVPPANQENTPFPQPTPLLLQFPFLKCPSPSTAWPNSVASLMPGSAMPPRGALCHSRQAGRALTTLRSGGPGPLHPIPCGHLRHCLSPDCEAKPGLTDPGLRHVETIPFPLWTPAISWAQRDKTPFPELCEDVGDNLSTSEDRALNPLYYPFFHPCCVPDWGRLWDENQSQPSGCSGGEHQPDSIMKCEKCWGFQGGPEAVRKGF